MHGIENKLHRLLFKIAGEKYKDLVTISLVWKPTVGEFLAARSSITKYEGNILYIKAENHIWLQEFVVFKPKLLAQLKEKTHLEIKNILFTV
ncbi:MAG: DUF721 domain-containing protein [Candidatus Cloacimonetes bacterium]|nr:DUF721 domain-containing protein [Candidatus Cloacimonadota bacterium]